MSRTHRVGYILLWILIFVLFGCSHYVISEKMRQQADKGLSFTEVQKNVDAYIGRVVIWGGEIVDYRDRQGETTLKIAETRLDRSQAPVDPRRSRGYFLARTKYLDARTYKEGEKVTLAGEIVGSQMEKPNDTTKQLPVVKIKEIYLWHGLLPPGGRAPTGWQTYRDYRDEYGF
jgi:outer membrane lipoprotein